MSQQQFMVLYDDSKGVTHSYCLDPMTRRVADGMAKRFTDLYVGKPYPNGKGSYDATNVRVVPFDKKYNDPVHEALVTEIENNGTTCGVCGQHVTANEMSGHGCF